MLELKHETIRDFMKSYIININKLQQGQLKYFKLKYRKKKSPKSIVINKKAISLKNKKFRIFPRFLGSIRTSKDKCLKHLKIEYDCRIQYEYNKWYVLVPIKKNCKKTESSEKKTFIGAFDPGVRTFQTLYSEKEVIKFSRDKTCIEKIQKKLDLFRSLRSKKQIKFNHYNRNQKRSYKKLKHLVDDLHFKIINYIKNNYIWILLPSFESQEMVKKNYNKKCNRNMMEWKHYKFKTRLIDSCMLDKTTSVILCKEAYTTATCTCCGKIDSTVGSKEIYKCIHCNLIIDRDFNAARNILLKYFSKD